MDMPNNSIGICITCKHRSYCLSFQNGLKAEIPIWDCNEYEHNDTEVIMDQPQYRAQAIDDCDSPGETTREDIKGLCTNCDNRNSCMLPITRGGVWHCEEYC